MALELYAHPFSGYCQKALIALYENEIPFTFHQLGSDRPENEAEWARLWPMKRMPLLIDDGIPVMEASVIIEHLDLRHPGAVRLVPKDPAVALPVRMMDRFFDNYVTTPMQSIVFNQIRPEAKRDPYGLEQARSMMERAYAWLDGVMRVRTWAAGESFSLADCAAAPALFYADWTHRIGDVYPHARAYRDRLLARPSFARAVDEARPYRPFFPLGAPDRD